MLALHVLWGTLGRLDSIHAAICSPHRSVSSGVHSGWVQKSNPKGLHWKRRWMVLDGTTIAYYVDDSMKAAKGTIALTAGSRYVLSSAHAARE